MRHAVSRCLLLTVCPATTWAALGAGLLLTVACGPDYGLESKPTSIQSGGGWAFQPDISGDVGDRSSGGQSDGGQSDGGQTDIGQDSTLSADVVADGTAALTDGAGLGGADSDASPPDGSPAPDDSTATLDATADVIADAGAPCAKPCTTDAACAAGGEASCTVSVCVAGCCKTVDALAGSACDDGDPCTSADQCGADSLCSGAIKGCDDGLLCTVDACAAATGACTHDVSPGQCAIDGACWVAGAAKPNQPCASCQPASSSTAWTAKPGCCGSDADCPAAGVCDAPTCAVSTGTCLPGKKLGCCTANTQCNDGNLCTLDTCTLSTGACKITPKTCKDASSCQQAVCDGKTGACAQAIKAGWCLIGGACVASGTSKPGVPCQACKPSSQSNTWTILVGLPCDDGEVCTASDTCTATAGCKGVAKTGCCKSHIDCAKFNSACMSATCDLKAHVCIKATQPSCCESGACCDPATHKLKGGGTLCAGTLTGYAYRCVGQQVQRRDLYPGCTGLDAKTCSADSQFAYKGPWTGLKNCPSNTLCTLIATGVMPTCKKKAPTGTCKGACGGPAADGTCQCGVSCTTLGTCCKDFTASCGCTSGACCDVAKKFLKPQGKACAAATEYRCVGQGMQKRSSAAVCNGTSSVCPVGAWGAWVAVQTCAAGTACTVAANKSGATCKAKAGSCVGLCGKKAAGGCWCDSKCTGFGDCCTDYKKTCACGANPQLTCKSVCGGKGAGGCWCDASCLTLGDCCSDKAACCGS